MKYVLVLLFDEEYKRVLVMRRKKDPYAGRINGVGGKVERNERPLLAACREVCEETGISLSSFNGKYHIINLEYLVTFIWPSEIEMSVFYGQIAFDSYKGGENEEGTYFWYPVESLLDMNNKELAGEGNLSYCVNYILLLEGKK